MRVTGATGGKETREMRGGGLLPLCCYRAQAMRKELKGKSIQRQRRCLLSDGCAVAELGPAAATRAPKEKTPYVSDEEEEVEEEEVAEEEEEAPGCRRQEAEKQTWSAQCPTQNENPPQLRRPRAAEAGTSGAHAAAPSRAW
ncbi:unnamed protein product [Prorocentrum cordatum]|uniref:Uncharacterized protein n=1 Tax=Prorocentrum cordatum TaxID=2364126 RepID=A0ABN9Q5Q1_9DINO|nr:unnamed protein product [Polarella glacialis]